jgi:GT2 family glycosyltransferase
MSTCLLVIDDGREDYLDRCLESAARYLPPMQACVMVSDPNHELGFAGAVQAGWEGALESGCEWVFHLESDFVFTEAVPLEQMRALACRWGIGQVALKRQPWNERECAAGGIVEADPEDFEAREIVVTDAELVPHTYAYTLHRKFFTTNPSLYSTALCLRGWPQVSESEGVFTHQLLADAYSFAFWGGPYDQPAVEHIGARRAGHGY